MNKRELERRDRINEIVALLNDETDEEKLLKIVMAKHFVSRRLAKEYLDSAKIIIELK